MLKKKKFAVIVVKENSEICYQKRLSYNQY